MSLFSGSVSRKESESVLSDEQPEGIYSTLSLRRRGVWEAVDSGVLIWRDNFSHFIFLFAVPVWIIALGLRLLPGDIKYFSYFFLWWLKPLFDRLVLHVISRRFFDASAFTRLRDIRQGLWKNIHSGLLGDLLWRRFSPYRGAYMPLRILECSGRNPRGSGKTGLPLSKLFQQRKKALIPGGLNFCSFVSVFGFALEVMLLMGEVFFVIMIAQIFYPTASNYVGYNQYIIEICIYAAFCLNMILVESLYVCMGFGLYINSRVEVEGWDLQILFRKFAGAEEAKTNTELPVTNSHSRPGDRTKFPSGINIKTIVLVCLYLTLLFKPLSQAVYAEDEPEFFPEDFPYASTASLENLREITASPDFGYFRDRWEIRFKNAPGNWDMPDVQLPAWMENIRNVFGVLLRLLVILAACAFLGFALFWLIKFYRDRSGKKEKFQKLPKTGANLLFQDEDPESLFAKSEKFFNSGFIREAWAACLAGCIGAYSRYYSVSFPVDTTEYGCIDLVCGALPGEEKKFGEIVQNWILLAYGHRVLSREAFERSLSYGRSLSGGRTDEP